MSQETLQFIHFLGVIAPLSSETIADLTHHIEIFEFPKNSLLLDRGRVCNYLYFVNRGLLRLFYQKDGKDITDYFASEGKIIGGIDSFFSRRAGEKMIETLESCTLTAISYKDLEKLYSLHHDLERVGRILSTGAFLSMQERLFSIQFHSARERYDELISRNPGILQRVSLGHIASYLGITQVTLSRIRGSR